jgi:alkylhydroperoxidase/carboxymuconolactone decarboxylase family protein YurZ
MGSESRPPRRYREFVDRYPRLAEAWAAMRTGEDETSFDEPTRRLIKLGIAIGALREGAVRSAARKALAAGLTRKRIEEIVVLAAGTIGLPSAVAAFTWIEDIASKKPSRRKRRVPKG